MNNLRSVFICDDRFCEHLISENVFIGGGYDTRINGENVCRIDSSFNFNKLTIFDNTVWFSVFYASGVVDDNTYIWVDFLGAEPLTAKFDLHTTRQHGYDSVFWTITLIFMGIV